MAEVLFGSKGDARFRAKMGGLLSGLGGMFGGGKDTWHPAFDSDRFGSGGQMNGFNKSQQAMINRYRQNLPAIIDSMSGTAGGRTGRVTTDLLQAVQATANPGGSVAQRRLARIDPLMALRNSNVEIMTGLNSLQGSIESAARNISGATLTFAEQNNEFAKTASDWTKKLLETQRKSGWFEALMSGVGLPAGPNGAAMMAGAPASSAEGMANFPGLAEAAARTDMSGSGRAPVTKVASDAMIRAGATPTIGAAEQLAITNAVTSGGALGVNQYNAPRQHPALTPQAFLGTNDLASVPAGMRNNNPGNLKYTNSPWQQKNLSGMLGPSVNTDQGDPQIVFSSPQAGMDSMVRLAVGKWDNGRSTAYDMISAPGGWTEGNRKAAENVAAAMGIKPTDKINLRDPATLRKFTRALIAQEHGNAGAAYGDEMIDSAINATLNGPGGNEGGGRKRGLGLLAAAPSMVGYTSGGGNRTNVTDDYVNNQFLPSAGALMDLGIWPGGENPYFSETTSSEPYKFYPDGTGKIDPVHKGKDHYGTGGHLAMDISIGRYAKQMGISEDQARSVINNMGGFLRQNVAGGRPGSAHVSGLIQRGQLGHTRHFHWAPKDAKLADLVPQLLQNPDALPGGRELVDSLVAAGSLTANPQGGYTLNRNKLPEDFLKSYDQLKTKPNALPAISPSKVDPASRMPQPKAVVAGAGAGFASLGQRASAVTGMGPMPTIGEALAGGSTARAEAITPKPKITPPAAKPAVANAETNTTPTTNKQKDRGDNTRVPKTAAGQTDLPNVKDVPHTDELAMMLTNTTTQA